jgi:hypothetical protein
MFSKTLALSMSKAMKLLMDSSITIPSPKMIKHTLINAYSADVHFEIDDLFGKADLLFFAI